MKAWDSDELVSGKPEKRGVDEVLGRHDDPGGKVVDRRTRDVPEVGGSCPRQDDLHPDIAIGEFVTQTLAEGEDESLGTAID